MTRVLSLLFTLIATAIAAPAIVWKANSSSAAVHSSEDVTAEDIFGELLTPESNDSGLAAVVFLLGRGQGGSESLTRLAGEGSLPGVSAKYNDAHCIHHHVSGVANSHFLARDVTRARPGHNVAQLSLTEFSSMSSSSEPQEMEVTGNGMLSKATKIAKKKAREVANANVLIVNVAGTDSAEMIDSAVVSAIDNKSIQNVVLSAVRSVDEVKRERNLEARRRMKLQEAAGRRMLDSQHRRLEDQDQQEENNAEEDAEDGQNQDMSGVVYVSMTPNILAGLLFFFLFTFVTYIGLGCMNMITGQDVYVDKMPYIGREA